MKVYVAGPYSQGDVAENVKAAIDAGNALMDRGHNPYVPHLTHFMHLLHPRPYKDWLDLDLDYLTMCDAVLRLPGPSDGADREVALAEGMDLLVFYSLDALDTFIEEELVSPDELEELL